ncbi:MAG TPA: FtsH protease activity modulator HflK [Bauldia sp.]|jgi:membrane protease subunit HflK
MPGIIHASGGWKGGNGGPWGQGPRNTGSTPPDLEELLRRSQDRLRRVLPGGGGTGNVNPVALIAILALVLVFAAYFFFTFRVQPNEVGVVLRFGAYARDAQPGLNFRLPYPIETVYTPEVTTLNRVIIGQGQDENGAAGRDIPEESLMLTGDENIVDIDFAVFWIINSAPDYLFHMQDPQGTVKAVSESAMREVVGQSNIQPLLTQARQITETKVEALIQKTLDEFGSGILVTQVQLLKVDPPGDVIASFRDVQAARADADRVQNEAQTYANKVVPEAKGQASQITEAAAAYRDRIIAEAQGQADRFDKVYESYKAAPDVTRRRMYLETMEQVLGNVDKVIIDRGAGSTNGVVPYLPLQPLTDNGVGPLISPSPDVTPPTTTTSTTTGSGQ